MIEKEGKKTRKTTGWVRVAKEQGTKGSPGSSDENLILDVKASRRTTAWWHGSSLRGRVDEKRVSHKRLEDGNAPV